jgi:Holliday junction resolvase-like predicted endonuclease
MRKMCSVTTAASAVKLGRRDFDVYLEEINASRCGVSAADCVAFAARMRTGEFDIVKTLLLVRFFVFIAVRGGQHEFYRAATESATREQRRLVPLCNRTAACSGWTL